MNNSFYVYIYLDQQKANKYKYGKYEFDYEPFYVGKGKDNRWKDHLKCTKNNIPPIIIKYCENMTELDALNLEKKLIKAIGRFDLKYGPLVNLTDGGDGASNVSELTKKKLSDIYKNNYIGVKHPRYGKKHSTKSKQIISKNTKKVMNQPEIIAKIKKGISEYYKNNNSPLLGKKLTKKTKEKMRLAKIGKRLSEQHKSKISESNKGRIVSIETRQKIREKHIGKKLSKETKEKISLTKKGKNHPMYGKHHSKETRKKMSEAKKNIIKI